MSNEKLSPLRAAFIAAQAALTALLQGIPTGRQDKPYLLLSLALALAGLLPPLSAMICGAVCGALCDLSGSGVIGFFSLSAAIVCAATAYWLRDVWQNRFLSRSLLAAAGVAVIIGMYYCVFRAWNDCGVLPHYLWRMLLTYICVFPLYGVNAIGRRRRHD